MLNRTIAFLVFVVALFLAFKMSVHVPTSEKYTSSGPATKPPLPGLFVSHGGPTFLYENDDFGNKGAWRVVRELGTRIREEWKPDYIVVISAHWQLAAPDLIEVAVPPATDLRGVLGGEAHAPVADWRENPLIYDFYGFPEHMYREKFRTWNSPFVSRLICEHLQRSGFRAKLTERGLDHGVWVPMKVAFPQGDGPEDMALGETPLVQVSLTAIEDDFDTHARLGEAISHLQNTAIWDPAQGKYLRGLVVCLGMSVHNLRDLGTAVRSGQKALPYVAEFNRLVSQTMQAGPETLTQLGKLKTKHALLLRNAHPTLEHFVPLVVAAGINRASNHRKVLELYNDDQLSLGWATFQLGEYVG